MCEKVLNQAICLKKYIYQKEYKEISELQELCSSHDNTNLKLELDYKLNMCRNSEIGLKNVNEFLYYIDEVLVAYLSISSFGRNIGELNGMTHPHWRKKGLFKKLFEYAIEECRKRGFNKILLLSDDQSSSAAKFIKSVGGKYDFSEYRMKWLNKVSSENINSINLRKAEKFDLNEIAKQNKVFFNDTENSESFQEDEEPINQVTYMIELKKEIIGKIRVEYSDNSAFISGFGILPDFRGKGHGKSALKEALGLIHEKNVYDIELDVECKNITALNLYKACGFEKRSVMNYYEY
jgi:GNAT superfamily N-acetyltransferase